MGTRVEATPAYMVEGGKALPEVEVRGRRGRGRGRGGTRGRTAATRKLRLGRKLRFGEARADVYHKCSILRHLGGALDI